MEQKTILITGATGFLGGYITRELSQLGFHLKLLIRGATRGMAKERFLEMHSFGGRGSASGVLPGQFEIIEGDISKNDLGLGRVDYLRLAETVDEVFHCAAATKFTSDRSDLHANTNITGTRHVSLFSVRGKLKRFHYMSTAYVAGRRRDTVLENELEKGQAFNNSYEESKYEAEKRLLPFAQQHRLLYTVYRPSIITGDTITGYTRNYDNIYIFGKGLSRLKERELRNNGKGEGISDPAKTCFPVSLRVPGDKHSTVNLIPVDYAARAIVALSRRVESINKAFHIVNPSPPTLGELAEWMRTALGVYHVRVAPLHEFQLTPHTLQERLFLQKTQAFQPYLFGEPYFDFSNTRSLLSGTGIECPLITQEIVNRYIQYAIDTNWGEKRQSADRATVPPL